MERKVSLRFLGILTAIAALFVLGALFLPALTNPPETNHHARCFGHLKQFGISMRLYAMDFNEYFPATTPLVPGQLPEGAKDGQAASHLALLYPSYVGYLLKLFECPNVSLGDLNAYPRAKDAFIDLNVDYAYTVGLKETAPPDSILMSDDFELPSGIHVSKPHEGLNHAMDGQNVLFVDGHVEWVPNVERNGDLVFDAQILAAREGQTWGPGYVAKLVD